MGLPKLPLIAVEKLVVVFDARVVKLVAIEESQVKVSPLAIVATKTWPKLLNDHSPGSSVIVDADTALPKPAHKVASWTVVLVEWAWPFDVPGVAVPDAPLVILKKFV